MKARLFFGLLLAMLIAGCGSQDNDVNLATGGGSTFVRKPLAGKLFLGAPIADVPVSVQTLDGNVLETQATDETGNFLFEGPLPVNFRLVATLDPENVFAREVRDFGPGETYYAAITVPTTLVSMLSQATPGASIDELEQKARQILKIPGKGPLTAVEESVSLPFSHLQFFAVATRNGGASAYLKVLAADGTVSQAPFLLREQSLSASLSGAPPRIAEKLEALRAREDVRLSTRSLIARGLEDPVVGILGPAGRLPSSTSNRAVQAQSLLTIPGLLGFVGQNLANKVLNDAENSFYTWVAQSLGWHYGTAQTLNDISVQLSGALQGIATISSDLKTGQLNTLFSQLSNDIDKINAFYTSLFNGANSVNSTYFSQPSSTVPTDVQSFLNGFSNDFTTKNFEGYLGDIQERLTGSLNSPRATAQVPVPPIVVDVNSPDYSDDNNMVVLARNIALNQVGVVVNSDTRWMANFPVRTSTLIDKSLQPLQTYAQWQVFAAYALAESAHYVTDPSSTIPTAQTYVENVSRSILSSRAQIPGHPISDRVFIDLQNGLMWYMDMQAKATSGNALTNSTNFSIPAPNNETCGTWRLPTYSELLTLQYRGAVAAAASSATNEIDLTKSTQGLQALGFTLTSDLNPTGGDPIGYVWAANWKFDGGALGSHTWSIDSQQLALALDRDKNQDGEFTPKDNEEFPYFMVRTLGPTPLIDIDPPQGGGGEAGSWPDAIEGVFYDFEAASVGVFSGWGVLEPVNGGTRAAPTANWVYNVGATNGYAVGNGSVLSATGKATARSSTGNLTESPTYLPLAYFLTNDGSGASVSSAPGSWGQVVYHPNSGQADTLASIYAVGYQNGAFPVNIGGTFDIVRAIVAVKLNSIQISPRNPEVNLVSQQPGDITQEQFLATGFLSDGSAVNLTGLVTWSAVDAATGQPLPGAVFSSDVPGDLKLTKSAGLTQNLNVTATINTTLNGVVLNGTDSTPLILDLN